MPSSRWSVRLAGLTVAAILGGLLPATAFGANPEGALDGSFGSGGKVTTPIANADVAVAVAIQPDGKVVVAGYSTSTDDDFAVVRYLAGGGLDPAFGSGGVVTTPIGTDNEAASAVAIQSDGKIVVAGYTNNGTDDDFALVRYNANGTLDTTFDGDGKVTTAIGPTYDDVFAVVLQPDGKIVAVGQAYNGSNFDVAIVRYSANGALDPSFSGDGKNTTAVGSADDAGRAAALQPDGAIVVAGSSNNGSDDDVLVLRYAANGLPDGGFGGGGKVTTPIGSAGDQANSVAIQPDGRIVVAATTNGAGSDIAVVRYTAGGVLDPSFGSGGKVITAIGSGNEQGLAIALQPDRKIVVAGFTDNGTDNDFALVRYTPNGALDPTFGTGGKVVTPIGSDHDYGNAIAIQPDGKIVVAGPASNGSDDDFAVARFIGDATAPYGAHMIGLPRWGTALTRTLAWGASDDNSGVATFDVRYRSAAYSASTYGSYTAFKTATDLPYATFIGSAGRTYCFSVRAHDMAGNVGSYGPDACIALPVNDRTLVRSGSWTSLASSSYYLSTGSRSTSLGAALTRTGVAYRHLAVVVTTCSTCGSIKVYRGTTLLKTISLVSSTTKHMVVIEVASSVGITTGTIVVKQASSGKAVTIEGLAVSLN